jgi:hypothetical protein
MFNWTKLKKTFNQTNITTNMRTMTNPHGDCNASLVIEFNHKKLTRMVTCQNDV